MANMSSTPAIKSALVGSVLRPEVLSLSMVPLLSNLAVHLVGSVCEDGHNAKLAWSSAHQDWLSCRHE
jgi:hypothetical protein